MDWMKNLTEELKDILREEAEIYKTILELTIKKTDIITAGHVKELDKITQAEQSLIVQIGKLEEIRERVVGNIEKFLQLDDSINMTAIGSYLKEEDRIEVEELKNQLVSILNEIKEKNALNNILIQDSLEYINLNINLLTNATTQNTDDNKNGKVENKQSKSLFDAKV